MKLHEHQAEFDELVHSTAAYFGLQDFQVEKDYYVSLLLKTLIEKSSNIVFKGGTSLSKCYDVIKRFSEVIDLNVELEQGKTRVSDGDRRRLKNSIVETVDSLVFEILNLEAIQSRKDFNMYEVGYQKLYENDEQMVGHIIIETSVAHRVFPCEELDVSNYITKFVESTDDPQEKKDQFFDQYEMRPFKSKVQTIDRTLIDKLFAICDYYEKEKSERYSRHLYDVHKIWKSEFVNVEDLKTVLPEIIGIRQKGRDIDTISCRPDYELRKKFEEVINTGFFKQDYRMNTSTFLFEEVGYDETIEALLEILDSGLLPEVIKEGNEST